LTRKEEENGIVGSKTSSRSTDKRGHKTITESIKLAIVHIARIDDIFGFGTPDTLGAVFGMVCGDDFLDDLETRFFLDICFPV
jgi:hypothetical protein